MMAYYRRPIEAAELQAVDNTINSIHSTKVDTLCDHVRVIFRAASLGISDDSLRNKIREECRIIMVYAKRMDSALKQYKKVNDYEL